MDSSTLTVALPEYTPTVTTWSDPAAPILEASLDILYDDEDEVPVYVYTAEEARGIDRLGAGFTLGVPFAVGVIIAIVYFWKRSNKKRRAAKENVPIMV